MNRLLSYIMSARFRGVVDSALDGRMHKAMPKSDQDPVVEIAVSVCVLVWRQYQTREPVSDRGQGCSG